MFASFRKIFTTFGARNSPKTRRNNPKRRKMARKRCETVQNGANKVQNGAIGLGYRPGTAFASAIGRFLEASFPGGAGDLTPVSY